MWGIVLHLGNKMANRRKDERNQKILALWNKGWRQKSIARMFKMTESAVQMTIARAKATPAKAVEQVEITSGRGV